MKETYIKTILLIKNSLPQNNMLISPFTLIQDCLFLSQVTKGTTKLQISKKLRLYKIDLSKAEKRNKKLKKVVMKSFLTSISKITIPNRIFFRPVVVRDIQKIEEKYEKYNLKLKIKKEDRFILSSLLAFNLRWENSFEIYKGDFYLKNNNIISIPLLHTVGTFSISESSVNQILKIPYKGSNIFLKIYLPKKDRIPILTRECLEAKFLKKKVEINIPEFSINTKINFKKVLREIGIRNIFDDSANFSIIDPENLTYLSKFTQQNSITVNEKGTKAYSITKIVGKTKSKVSKVVPITFKANRPFYFTITDNKNNILLLGRLVNPKK